MAKLWSGSMYTSARQEKWIVAIQRLQVGESEGLTSSESLVPFAHLQVLTKTITARLFLICTNALAHNVPAL